jgi:hypothetical protein
MLDRVTFSCVQMKKCEKIQTFMSMDFEKYLGWYASFNISGYADTQGTRIALFIFLIVELKSSTKLLHKYCRLHMKLPTHQYLNA